MRWHRSLGPLVLALLAAQAAPAVVLQYKYQVGETFHYQDHLTLAFEADASVGQRRRLQLRSDSRIQQTVKEAEGDTFVLDLKTVENETRRTDESGREDTAENLGSPEQIRIRANGLIAERKELKEDPQQGPSAGLVTPLDEFAIVQQVFDHLTLPAGEVEPGAEWPSAMTLNLTPDTPDETTVELTVTTKFARLVTVSGETCAELMTEFSIPLREPSNNETRELNVDIRGAILGHLTSYFSIERGRSLVELATLGVHGSFSIAPPGAGDKLTVRGRMKCNIKTVLED